MVLDKIKKNIYEYLQSIGVKITFDDVKIQRTQSCFTGDFTFVLFDLSKKYNLEIEKLGNGLGNYLKNNSVIKNFNLIKGFLNMSLGDKNIFHIFENIFKDKNFLHFEKKNKSVLVEYSSPNTNKPLHLGHLRNNFLGYAVCEILKAVGYNVKAVTLINDRGIHICKSMVAYLKIGGKKTPDSENIKGDHFVGDYYVAFEKIFKKQKEELKIKDDKDVPILQEAQEMLQKWEQHDLKVLNLWKKLNSWVLKGFEETYKKIGISFDKTYFESETYLLGKEIINEGLSKGIFFKKEDGSVWIDLKDVNLDEKLLLRGNGTSVYITQDLGTAELRYSEFHPEKMIYVVGDEQEYHFNVLKSILKKLGRIYANEIYHLSYGMISLPSGKMKSREGTVVDADELIAEMVAKAEEAALNSGKLMDLNKNDRHTYCEKIGLAALKFYLLKVTPQKSFTFDPNKSIDFQGDTGTFILYTYVRICSIFRKNNKTFDEDSDIDSYSFSDEEKNIILTINEYRRILQESAETLNPSILAQYVLALSKTYNKFYDFCNILKETDINKKKIRLMITKITADILKQGLQILGIELVEKM